MRGVLIGGFGRRWYTYKHTYYLLNSLNHGRLVGKGVQRRLRFDSRRSKPNRTPRHDVSRTKQEKWQTPPESEARSLYPDRFGAESEARS